MSRVENIKEKLGWMKVVFAVFAATLVSLIGWTATHYQTAEKSITFSAVFFILFLSIAIVKVNKQAFVMIDELEEL